MQGRAAVARAVALHPEAGRAKNVVLFVGDGMGIATVTAARILEGQRRGGSGEENALAFETLSYVALAKVYNTNQQVPDSAGTMTALITGVKTRAGLLSVDESAVLGDYESVSGAELPTLLEEAEMRGLATGVVTTARLTHATPAACYAKSAHRDWESDADLPEAARVAGFPDIARQLVEFSAGDGLEVALGGGRAAFRPAGAPDPEYPDDPARRGRRLDGRDLTETWRERHPGGAYVWNRAQFEALDVSRRDPLLGLFEPSHMRFETDRAADGAGEPSLSEMTGLAIDILARAPRGFVLVVEGGRIDHGHHLNNAYRALEDAIEFSSAVRVALERVPREQTLVVVTADHGHVFSLGGYPTRGNDILGYVVGNDARGEAAGEPARDAAGQPYTALAYGNGPGALAAAADREALARRPETAGGPLGALPAELGAPRDPRHRDYQQRSAVALALETHSGADVAIYAGGPGAALFHGVQEQNYVYHAITAALGWHGD